MKTIQFILPNANVNKFYQVTVKPSNEAIINIIKIKGLAHLGLIYDAEKNQLTGTPVSGGDYPLTIYYQHHKQTYSSSINLAINDDPKSLWKNIPSDSEAKYWKADEDQQGLNGFDQWKLIAASQRGRSHAHIGSFRDDDFALTLEPQHHWHIAAVADGAGSSAYSREAARIIVNHSSKALSKQLQHYDAQLITLIEQWQQDNDKQALTVLLYDVFSPVICGAVDQLIAMAKKDQHDFKDYYSTLLIAAHKPLAKGSLSIAYWIGDGGLAIYNAGQSVKLLGRTDSGDYAGQTRFLDPQAKEPENIKKRLHFSFDDSFTGLVLMTDGMTDPLFETDYNLEQISHWDVFWRHNIQPYLDESPKISAKQLNDSLDFWSQGNHDDRTLAIIYR